MSKVYKISMFICDLDEKMDIDSIKELIGNALLENPDSCCFSFFEEVEEGPSTYCDEKSTPEQWEKTKEEWRDYFARQ